MYRIILCTTLLIACLYSCPSAFADSTTEHLRVGEEKREYLVHVPPNFSASKSLPVVMVFHGGGGEDSGTESMTGMDDVADQHNFIAVYPEGTRRTWNAGLCCGYAAEHNIDDVAFVAELIRDLHAHYNIDLRRVYATGISNGAQMSYRLSCELSESIAAIAPVSGQLEMKTPCLPKRPVPVLHIHGTADPCSPYNGGSECGGCWGNILPMLGDSSHHWSCPPVEELISQTAERNHCPNNTRVTFSKGAVTCHTYDHCPVGDDVTLCKIEGGGHSWPGSETEVCRKHPKGFICRKYTEAVGPTNFDINASQFMWDFFAAHHL